MKKQSKLSVLLYVIFEEIGNNVMNIEFTENYCKNWFLSHSFSEIEELSDDLGYWLNTGNPEEDIQRAQQKILNLINWFEKTYYTKVHKPFVRWLFDSIIASKFDLKIKIKLLLYSFVHYKNPRIINSYFKKTTGFDNYGIENEIIRLLQNNTFHNLSMCYITGLGELGAFLNYYHKNDYYFQIFAKTELIKLYKEIKNANTIQT